MENNKDDTLNEGAVNGLNSAANNYEKMASELVVANKKLALQNQEIEKRAAELVIANKELLFQNEEKGKRAAELIIANEELLFQNEEKGKRAAELIIANEELLFQNEEKGKRAAELIIANEQLVFENAEKGKRAAELIIANEQLVFENAEKEKRAHELSIANQDLISFTYVSSHDLQEPLRKIQNFVARIMEEDEKNLSTNGKLFFNRISKISERMQELIEDLLTYSRTKSTEHEYLDTNLNDLLTDVLNDFEDVIKIKEAKIGIGTLGNIKIIPFQVRQLFVNLIGNSLKFSKENVPTEISINGTLVLGSDLNFQELQNDKNYLHIRISDNGIGFDSQYKERIFEVFQRLHSFEEYHGTGIGLAICKRIVENHQGIIMADGQIDVGASVDFYLLAN